MELEFINGWNFRDFLDHQACDLFYWESFKQFAFQLAEALKFAHDRNIIQRDIKPKNMMVTPDGIVKIIDFGLAAPRHVSDGPRHLNTGGFTVAYTSPQQLSCYDPNPADDIYSFGATLYEMLTGSQIFDGDSRPLEDQVRFVIPPDPNERLRSKNFKTSIPKHVAETIMRCLEKTHPAILLLGEDRRL